MRIGSLFTGYGGLDKAVEQFFGAHTVWTSDIDKGACKIIAHRFPDIPNHGDITTIDWASVEPVDILTGGFPCQDLSHAGKRLGLKPGTRSGLWSHMAYAISQLRPRYVIAENVRGLLSASAESDVESCAWCVGGAGDGEPPLRALGAVLGDLVELGYVGSWIGLRAADVGAPHGRFRIFVVAEDANRSTGGERRQSAPGQAAGRRPRADAGRRGGAPAANASSERHGRGKDAGALGRVDGEDASRSRERERSRKVAGDRSATAAADTDDQGPQGGESARGRDLPHRGTAPHAASDGWNEGRAEPARKLGRPNVAVGGDASADTASQPGRVGDGDDVLAGSGTQRREPATGGSAAADTIGSGRDGWAREPIGCEVGGASTARSGEVAWGDYESAIRRWERVLGRPAPAPTETGPKGGQRLSPRFVEWMMGLDAGHVTDVPGLTRNEQLKALGNGVVPQQALEALRRALPEQVAA